MPESLATYLQGKSARDIINDVGLFPYEDVNETMRETVMRASEIVRTILLVIAFDTEVQMNGMLGFLENRTGIYFDATIDAFQAIDAIQTVRVLEEIRHRMEQFGVTPHQLREDMRDLEEFAIRSFSDIHGTGSDEMADVIDAVARRLYLYHQEGEDISHLLEAYVELRKEALMHQVRAYEQRSR